MYWFLAIAAWFVLVGLFMRYDRPATRRRVPEPCAGIEDGCPVCLAAAIAAGVIVGDWLTGD